MHRWQKHKVFRLQIEVKERVMKPCCAERTGRGSDLYSSVTAEVKVKLVGMCDVRVHGGTSRNVSTTSDLIKAEERLVSLY